MSADEDTELRDLVAQALESNGVLGKIKAQLRASVFLALEEQESIQNKAPLQNQELKKFISTKDGKLVAALVREFLEFFHLDFSLAVFDPESGSGDYYEGRSSLARHLNIPDSNSSQPLLTELLKHGSSVRSNGEGSSIIIPKDLNPNQISEARKKFEYYDADKNGTIDKDELRKLFCDIFPGFNKNMIDRYVTDEFRAADKNLSNDIDFDEFLDMYQRLFIQCRSVISSDVSALTSPRPDSPTKIPSPAIKKTTFSFPPNVENHKVSKKTENTSESSKSLSKAKPKTLDMSGDEDSFFDDPVPKSNDNSRSLHRNHGSRSPRSPRPNSPKSPRPSQIPVKSGSRSVKENQASVQSPTAIQSDKSSKDNKFKSTGFLAGAPPLNHSDRKSPDMEDDKDFRKIDKNLADLGFDVPDDDYDDDFESSNVSPIGPTPRSARSDHNVKSIEEEINEDIDDELEDLSVAEDLLKSDNSGNDDLTTDRTVSPTDQSTAFDYAEEVQ